MKIKCDRCPEPSVTAVQLFGALKPDATMLCALCRSVIGAEFVMWEKPIDEYIGKLRS